MSDLTVILEDPIWKKQRGFEVWEVRLQEIFHIVLENAEYNSAKFSANLLLTNNAELQELNSRFRAKNVPTNVLSFPQIIDKTLFLKKKEQILGDIAISYEKILEESREFGIDFFDRATHLLVHGILHLLGFDHIQEKERETMENLEIKILKFVGIDDPYGDK